MTWEFTTQAFFAPFTRGWEHGYVWIIFIIGFGAWLYSRNNDYAERNGEGFLDGIFTSDGSGFEMPTWEDIKDWFR